MCIRNLFPNHNMEEKGKKGTNRYEIQVSPARYDQNVQDTPTFPHRKSDISAIGLETGLAGSRLVDGCTDRSQSGIKESADLDASFCFIHRVWIFYFKNTHRLSTTHPHQYNIQKREMGGKARFRQVTNFPHCKEKG